MSRSLPASGPATSTGEPAGSASEDQLGDLLGPSRMPLGVFFFGKQFHYRGRGPLHEEKARFGPTREAAATCPQGP